MQCTSTAMMNVLWNDEPTSDFKTSRGVRQGDPLSPYLFVLCMERLSHFIHRECEAKRWKPLWFRKKGPRVSHLFFADDLVLLMEASTQQADLLREVMRSFCEVSGHRINLDKSKVFVSGNLPSA